MVVFAFLLGFTQVYYVYSHWCSIFRTYRMRIFQMRQGIYFFDRSRYSECGAASFVGYQVAFMTFASYIFFWVITFFFALFALGGTAVDAILSAPNFDEAAGLVEASVITALTPP